MKEKITIEKIREIAQYIKDNFHPEKVILFGSYAYGTPTSSSDIDLMVIMETELRPVKQAVIIRHSIRENVDTTTPMDMLVRTPEFINERLKIGDMFIRTVTEKGVLL